MDATTLSADEIAPDPLEALLGAAADTPERTAQILAHVRDRITSRRGPDAAPLILQNLERLGPAAPSVLIALLDRPLPTPLQPLLDAARPLALSPDSPPQLARLVLRAVVRWGEPRQAQAALGLQGPASWTPLSGEADGAADRWRGFADQVQIGPDVRLSMEALVQARLGDSKAAVGALAAFKALGRPAQAVAVLEQIFQIAASADDRALLNALVDLMHLVPPQVQTLLLEEQGRWDEALDLILDVPTGGSPELRRLAIHVRRRSVVEGAAAAHAALVERAARGEQHSWAAALLALRLHDPVGTPHALRLGREILRQEPGNSLLAEALDAAVTCWGDLPAVRALWDELINPSAPPPGHRPAAEGPVLRAIAALRLGRALDFSRALRMLESRAWIAGEPHNDNLVTLHELAAAAGHSELHRICTFITRLQSADALAVAQAARIRGAQDLALRLARHLQNATDLTPMDMERVGDLFALHGAEGEAFAIYRRIASSQAASRELTARLLASLDADEDLGSLMDAGEPAPVLAHLQGYLAEDMDEHAFELRRLARPAELAVLGRPFVEAIAPGEFQAPHARFAGDPPVWRAQTVQQPGVWAAEVASGEVIGGSAAVLVGGGVIYPPLEAPNARHYSHRDSAAVIGRGDHLVLRLDPLARRFPAAINMVGFGASNYYHWLYDICSRFVGLQALGDLPADAVILVDEATLGISQLQEVLTRLNPAHLPLVPVAHGERVLVERLTTASPAAWGPFHMRDAGARFEPADCVILPEAVQLLRDLAPEEIATAAGPKRILLTRRGLANARLQNEPEIATLLQGRFGFEVVDPGRLSFAEQVRAFASAEAIVGASGAAMANLAFCRPWATVFCLMADRYDYSAWPTLAEAAGAEVVYVAGQIQEFSRNRNHSPFTVDPDVLAQALVGAGFG